MYSKRYVDKELSWLAFNERVLQEAEDVTNPLVERIRFLGIYSSNRDEFYKIRFADLRRNLLISAAQGKDEGYRRLLAEVKHKIAKNNEKFDSLYHDLLRELARNQIFLLNERQLSEPQQHWLRDYFQQTLRPLVRSILIDQDTNLVTFLRDDSTYLVAKQSRVIESMIHAACNGKKVTVVVELQARFDEEANIEWSRRLKNAGVHVIFSIPGLKIHSKLFLISRLEEGKLVRYAHIGTGNFNESTAKLYTDYALLTKDPRITGEIRQVFNFIENPYRPVSFHWLLVAPLNMRKGLYRLIDAEMAAAKTSAAGHIKLKLNNLVDQGLIEKLYAASAVGVSVCLLVRGMCSLVPGVSENIKVISILDRFLEHDRVYLFGNQGYPRVFISSADWMTRNVDHRIEVSVELLDNDIRQQVIAVLELLFSDTVKARVVDQAMSNRYVTRGRHRKIRGQLAVYHYLAEWPQAARAPSVLPAMPAISSVIVPPDADDSPSAARRRRGQGG